MKRILLIPIVLLCGIVVGLGFYNGNRSVVVPTQIVSAPMPAPQAYLYYMLKDPTGFVLARALKGVFGQPLGQPQQIAAVGDNFGLIETDYVSSLQLSPDGNYLAIDGVRADSEQVWMFDTVHAVVAEMPPAVSGNFLHWLPGGNGHTFLYRPMFPLGPDAPMDGGSWNPGLWTVDAASGVHRNIDIGVPSANIVDAAPSPDGAQIVYSTSVSLGAGSSIFSMDSNGRKQKQLLKIDNAVQSIAGFFTWSPDGSQIAYERLADSATPFLPSGLWVMNNQGGQQERLADADGGHGYMPVWSPDSTKIAFVARTNVSDTLANVRIQSMQSAIGIVNVLTHKTWLAATAQQTGRQLNINPSWNSGSGSITFTALDPINMILGGAPRYWSVSILGTQEQSQIEPLTADIPHFIATN